MIAETVIPQARRPQQRQPKPAPDPGRDTALSFAAALAAQAQSLASPDGSAAQASAITPRIGSGAHTFAESALLVDTAAQFHPQALIARAPFTAATPRPTPLPLSDLGASLTSAVETALAQFAALHTDPGTAIGTTGPAPAHPAIGSNHTPSQRGPAIATGLPMQTARPAPGEPAAARGKSDPAQSLTKSPGRARTAPGGSFAVHWLPVEGGIRLLVRLARLPADLRGELEMRLHDLFREHGVILRALDFHETGA